MKDKLTEDKRMMDEIRPVTLAELDHTLEYMIESEYKGGANSSLSQLKSALYDWRLERHWEKPDSATVYGIVEDGIVTSSLWYTYAKRGYSNGRHLYTMEHRRGKGDALNLYKHAWADAKSRGFAQHRCIANKPANLFHLHNLKFRPCAITKSGMLSFFLPIYSDDLLADSQRCLDVGWREVYRHMSTLGGQLSEQIAGWEKRGGTSFSEEDLDLMYTTRLNKWTHIWDPKRKSL